MPPQPDPRRREARCVLVYHGPRRAGTTETLHAIRRTVPGRRRGDVLARPSGVHPALVVEHLPLSLGPLGGLIVRLDLVALPDHEALPLLGDLLRRADGIVFVADAQPGRLEANREALRELEQTLARAGVDRGALPFAFQWNKADLPDALPPAELARALGAAPRTGFPAVATTGAGVLAPLRDVALQAVQRLRRRSDGRRAWPPPSRRRANGRTDGGPSHGPAIPAFGPRARSRAGGRRVA
ncbi:MAG: hypothetical protein M9894_37875 [Planctomycetes bacterium]|nr:hypothetical protein [Planctomycetota bacterium]